MRVRASYKHGGGHRWLTLPQGVAPDAFARSVLLGSRILRPVLNDDLEIIGQSTDYMYWRVEWGTIDRDDTPQRHRKTGEILEYPTRKPLARDYAGRFKLNVHGVEYTPMSEAEEDAETIPQLAELGRVDWAPASPGQQDCLDRVRLRLDAQTAYWVRVVTISVPGVTDHETDYGDIVREYDGHRINGGIEFNIMSRFDLQVTENLFYREADDPDSREWALADTKITVLPGHACGPNDEDEDEDEDEETDEEKQRRDRLKDNSVRDTLLLTAGIAVVLAGGYLLVEGLAGAAALGVTGETLTGITALGAANSVSTAAETAAAAEAEAVAAEQAAARAAQQLAQNEYNLQRAANALERLQGEVLKHQAAVNELGGTAAERAAADAVFEVEREVAQARTYQIIEEVARLNVGR